MEYYFQVRGDVFSQLPQHFTQQEQKGDCQEEQTQQSKQFCEKVEKGICEILKEKTTAEWLCFKKNIKKGFATFVGKLEHTREEVEAAMIRLKEEFKEKFSFSHEHVEQCIKCMPAHEYKKQRKERKHRDREAVRKMVDTLSEHIDVAYSHHKKVIEDLESLRIEVERVKTEIQEELKEMAEEEKEEQQDQEQQQQQQQKC